MVDFAAIDEAIDARRAHAFEFLEKLISEPSTVGNERGALEVLATEMEELGFEIRRIPIPETIGADPIAGTPQQSYEGRYDVLAVRPGQERTSLLFNGHVDVVPAHDEDLWSTAPFVPVRRGNRMYGRGSGDMKCGFAMTALALMGIRDAAPDLLDRPIGVLGVIEEECTGNGTLAAARAGVGADVVVLPEPTGLDLLTTCAGVLWTEIVVRGRGAHAESADTAINAYEALHPLIEALRAFSDEMNSKVDDPEFVDLVHPYNLNIGTIAAGDWPSSVPAKVVVGARIGFPRKWTVEEAEKRVSAVLTAAAERDPWLSTQPPEIRFSGLRAQGYSLAPNDPLAAALRASHQAVHGSEPQTVAMGSTTDARFYINEFDTPAICYGPRVGNIHAVDEYVELDSIVEGARTLTRFIAAHFSEA